MHALLFLTLLAPTPTPTRVEGPIDLGTLTVARARQMNGVRAQFIVWRISLVDEFEDCKHFDVWHSRDVHCFVRLVKGDDVPVQERLIVEGRMRVWDVPGFRIGDKRIEGWTTIRIERATVVR